MLSSELANEIEAELGPLADDDEPAAAVAAPTRTQPTPEPISARLTAVILDDPDLPPTLRGKTAAELNRARTEAETRASEAGRERNELARSNAMLQATIALIQRREQEPPAQPTPPAPAPKWDFTDDPDGTKFAASIEQRAADRATAPISQELATLRQTVQAQGQELENAKRAKRDVALRESYIRTAQKLEIPLETFDRLRFEIVGIVAAERLDPYDEAQLLRAGEILKENHRAMGHDLGAKPAPATAQPAAVPGQQAALAPAPPVGGGSPGAAAPQSHAAVSKLKKLTRKGREQFAEITKGFKLSAADTVEIVNDLLRTSPELFT